MKVLHKLGVLGNPTEHSLSPFIHNRFAREAKINFDYRPYTVAESDLELFFKDFCKDDKFLGLNVTLPYKKEVFHLCQKTTDKSKLISAVNTLFKQERFVVGESTDGFGLISDFKLKNIFLRDKKILIFGAGGAVQSILPDLINSNPSKIIIKNRTQENAQKVVKKFNSLFDIQVFDTENFENSFDLVIHGASVSHFDAQNDYFQINAKYFSEETIFYDLNYSLNDTDFCRWARLFSENVYDGMGMLICQAAESFKIWFDLYPNITNVINDLEGMRNV
tara:strand:+ start:211 stop:1044 length:834 start_codon:yes stop_codon:yes gene_type:complete